MDRHGVGVAAFCSRTVHREGKRLGRDLASRPASCTVACGRASQGPSRPDGAGSAPSLEAERPQTAAAMLPIAWHAGASARVREGGASGPAGATGYTRERPLELLRTRRRRASMVSSLEKRERKRGTRPNRHGFAIRMACRCRGRQDEPQGGSGIRRR
jgi:hypothetical protein